MIRYILRYILSKIRNRVGNVRIRNDTAHAEQKVARYVTVRQKIKLHLTCPVPDNLLDSAVEEVLERAPDLIVEVSISGELFANTWVLATAKLERFCDAIARLPKVRACSIQLRERPSSLKLITRTIRGANNLTNLEIGPTVLDGSPQDFLEFASVLSTFKQLKALTLNSRCVKWADGQNTFENANPIFEALSKMDIHDLNISGIIPTLPSEHVKPLGELLLPLSKMFEPSNDAFKTWALDDKDTSTDKLETISAVMKHHSAAPWLLSVSCYLSQKDLQITADLLAYDHQKLRVLFLYIFGTDTPLDQHLAPFISALGSNTRLDTLWFIYSDVRNRKVPMSDKMLLAFEEMLATKNWTLVNLLYRLHGRSLEVEDDVSFDNQKKIVAKIAFQVKLNRLGRRRLLHGTTKSRYAWVDKLHECGDDVSAIFYFLSMNPLLCETAMGIGHETKRRTKFPYLAKFRR